MIFWLFLIVTAIFGGLVIFSDQKYKYWTKKGQEAWQERCITPYSSSERKATQAREEKADEKKTFYASGLWTFFAVLFWVFLIATLIMGLVLICSYACAPSNEIHLREEYNTLVYQFENEYFTNDAGDTLGSKALLDDIRDYNATIKSKQYWEKNFWLGIFYPNIYSDLPLIPLS